MKIITFAVPCFNSEAYMEKCIDSLLVAGEDAQIVIVDDGSHDRTAEIADEYERKYPTICKAVHQENGGHGEAVNAGLRNAVGKYYKVVDSDDWLESDALKKVVAQLKAFIEEGKDVDLLVANYVYERVYNNTQKAIRYPKCFLKDQIMVWDNVGKFKISQNLLMHTLIYKTAVLKESGLVLPKHTFYVDNLFAYVPLPFVKTLYYMNVDLYRYFIGRPDQSVNEQVMIKRIDQQIKVNKLMIEAYSVPKEVKSERLKKYMLNYLSTICMVTSIMCILSKDPALYEKKRELWRWFEEKDPEMYSIVRHGIRGIYSSSDKGYTRGIARICYKIAHKIYKFN